MMTTKREPTGDAKMGKRLRKYRESVGLTQKQVANRIGISQGSVSQIETGGIMPEQEHLDALADLYDETLDDLRGRGVMAGEIGNFEQALLDAFKRQTMRKLKAAPPELLAEIARDLAALVESRLHAVKPKPPPPQPKRSGA